MFTLKKDLIPLIFFFRVFLYKCWRHHNTILYTTTQQELACLLLCRKDVFIWAATSAHIEDDDEHDYYHLGIKRATHTE